MCLPLPGAYRSLPRPSSSCDAKASTVRPFALGRVLQKLSFRSHELGSVSTCVETKHTCMSCILDFFCCQRAKIRYETAFLSSCLFSNRLMVGVTGVGPVTSSLSGTRSNQLSYTPSSVLSSPMFGGGSRTRTGDIRLAKPTLYQLSYAPVETHSDAPGLAVAGGRGDTRQHFFLCGKSILNIWEMREASLAHPVSSGRALRAQRRIDHRNSHC